MFTSLINHFSRCLGQLQHLNCAICDLNVVTEVIVRQHLPGGEIISSATGNVSVSLPSHAVGGIPRLFQILLNEEKLVTEWGISNTTLRAPIVSTIGPVQRQLLLL